MTAPVAARPAASLLLVRDGRPRADGRTLEVLMMERHGDIEFAGGAVVFPGGKVERSDATQRYTGRFPSITDLPSRMAAIREAFEETGVLLARHLGSRRFASRQDQRLFLRRVKRRAGLRDRRLLLELQGLGMTLAAESLVPFSHWITPEIRKIRFDTRFYLAAMPRGQMIQHDGTEAVGAFWDAPEDIVGRHGLDIGALMFPQRMNLIELARARCVAEALALARSRPVVPILPKLEKTDDAVFSNIPEAAGYGGSRFIFSKRPPAP